MKVILSRKGFDSSTGGYPSPILPDNTLASLPIPDSASNLFYNDLKIDTTNLFDVMRSLKPSIKASGEWEELTKKTECHLDPDIDNRLIKRESGWRGLFGQGGAAQKHLENQGVTADDLFLFFGWFRKTKRKKGKLVFDPQDKQGRHIIYGYLQVADILNVPAAADDFPSWMRTHPHLIERRRKIPTNTIYIAREEASWDTSLPGYGPLDFDEKLVLSKEGYKKSCWDLPDFFRNVKISYHKASRWKEDYFLSVARGQEFVVESNKEVVQWAKEVINAGKIT
ncbi:hypothetical protein [Pseudalkalibacillus caeni]|uniref:Nucleotide modification associated domain-containing protein n=1 Tax=Exobacillus caeni TaxID=2574798 RepID=A0A5R9EW65_9BACL|nr:hypothetical protein [Pseudalkalibacillus caeni]TLS35041.1 hypothetical protein FCL54_22545 [Pseudalkalibacillus caeni]